MTHPIWQTKGKGAADTDFVRFCAGRDVNGLPPVDLSLLEADLWTNRAQAQILYRAGVLNPDELQAILDALRQLEREAGAGNWTLDPASEDIHMAVEGFVSTQAGAEIGGKLHTGRSRNDQVATDMRLWLRDSLINLIAEIGGLVESLLDCGAQYAETVMPGWTHQRPAMVSSWGSFLTGYASSLERDMERLLDVLKRIDRSPLGAAAGYGTSWPLDRDYAARLLAFSAVLEHPADATGNRWEPDAEAAGAIALFLRHTATMAQDWITLSSPAYGLLVLPKELTTGSSIMPQKRNPDLLEITRAKCALGIGTATSLLSLGVHEVSGYQRDLQWSKYLIMDLFREIVGLAPLLSRMVCLMSVNAARMREACERGYLEAADVADLLARKRGKPFREAYRIVSDAVAYAESGEGNQVPGRLTREVLAKALADAQWDSLSDEEAVILGNPEVNLLERKNLGGPSPERIHELIEIIGMRVADRQSQIVAKQQHIEACRSLCRDVERPIEDQAIPVLHAI